MLFFFRALSTNSTIQRRARTFLLLSMMLPCVRIRKRSRKTRQLKAFTTKTATVSRRSIKNTAPRMVNKKKAMVKSRQSTEMRARARVRVRASSRSMTKKATVMKHSKTMEKKVVSRKNTECLCLL